MEERDINRTPPSRAFLEEHVDEANFLEYVSRRSPVFKERAMPASKREAIALMLEQPNLIKRPILVLKDRAIFGFDKKEPTTGSNGRRRLPARTSVPADKSWYPCGQGFSPA